MGRENSSWPQIYAGLNLCEGWGKQGQERRKAMLPCSSMASLSLCKEWCSYLPAMMGTLTEQAGGVHFFSLPSVLPQICASGMSPQSHRRETCIRHIHVRYGQDLGNSTSAARGDVVGTLIMLYFCIPYRQRQHSPALLVFPSVDLNGSG